MVPHNLGIGSSDRPDCEQPLHGVFVMQRWIVQSHPERGRAIVLFICMEDYIDSDMNTPAMATMTTPSKLHEKKRRILVFALALLTLAIGAGLAVTAAMLTTQPRHVIVRGTMDVLNTGTPTAIFFQATNGDLTSFEQIWSSMADRTLSNVAYYGYYPPNPNGYHVLLPLGKT